MPNTKHAPSRASQRRNVPLNRTLLLGVIAFQANLRPTLLTSSPPHFAFEADSFPEGV